jgi:prepilin signal peptidase PulO-like enzyme (type II secretory pathway)
MITLLLIGMGLILGSFVNALVWRLHEKKDWVTGRSECPHCHHVLGPLDLIPVISWLFLRGKCRYCQKKIDDNPLVELALPTLFVASYYFWPVDLTESSLVAFIFWLLFLVGFVALAVYDLRWYLLPDKIVFPLIALAVVQVLVISVVDSNWRIILGAAGGALVISGIFYLIFQVSNGQWIGGGDVKLGIVLGLLSGGVIEGFLLLFTASVLGMLISLPLMMQGKANRKTQLPFGPLLIAGLIIVKLFGPAILGWYTGMIYA